MTQRAKLEFELNKPTEIEFLFDECVKGNSQYGKYFLYCVKALGKEFSYFPPEIVHNQIKSLRRGDKAVITKLANQRGSKIITIYDVQVKGVPVTTTSEELEEAPQEEKYADRYYETLLQSYRDAIRIQEELNGLVDITKVAVTLFIARSR